MSATTVTHPGSVCGHTWSTGEPCTARCAIGPGHQCTVDRGTHGADHRCCCGEEERAAKGAG